MNEDLIYQVLETVSEIPKGCIATYGQIARLIDHEGLSIFLIMMISEFFFFTLKKYQKAFAF